MNEQHTINEQEFGEWEMRIKRAAETTEYPATPDIANAVHLSLASSGSGRNWSHRWLRIAAIVLLVGAGLMLVPDIRARVLEIIQIGVITIFPQNQIEELPPEFVTMEAILDVEITPVDSIFELTGVISLEEAKQQNYFDLLLPAYPPDLGEPDHIYYDGGRNSFARMTIVWTKPGQPNEVLMSLHMLLGDHMAFKLYPAIPQETEVNGHNARWLDAPHTYEYMTQDIVGQDRTMIRRFVGSNVLLWYDGKITYRLESDFSLEESKKIASSLAEPQ